MSSSLIKASGFNSSQELAQLVTFSIGREQFGADVLKVKEIIRVQEITTVPNSPSIVEGMLNLRGTVIPVVSLRKKFGLDDKIHSSETRVIVANADGRLTGFIVDAVFEVISVQKGMLQAPPAITFGGTENAPFIVGVMNLANKLLMIVDVDALAWFEDLQQAG